MQENKTKENQSDAREFIRTLDNEKRKEDALEVLKMMEEVTGEKPVMWGTNIVGYGKYHYKYASGREGEWFITGFSPRKQNITLYFNYFFEQNEDLMSKLGTYKTGKACLYVKKLEDIDRDTLRALIKRVYEEKKENNSL